MSLIKKDHFFNIFNVLIFFASIALGVFFGKYLTYKDIEPVISILQNTSAMIFTIMGIWIAYLYPNAILRITQAPKLDVILSSGDEKRIKLIVGTVIISAIVLIFLVLFLLFKAIVINTPIYSTFPVFFKSCTLSFIAILCYVQLACLYIVIASNVNFIIDFKSTKNVKAINDNF